MKTHALLALGLVTAGLIACGPGTSANSSGPPPETPATRTVTSAQPSSSARVPDAAAP